MKLSIALGYPFALASFCVPLVALVQPVAVAKSATEVNQIAETITVKITAGDLYGSGILLQKQGDVYTVLTAAHVVKEGGEEDYTITTADDQRHRILASSRRVYPGDVDLAVVKFRSTGNYKLAELGDSNPLRGGMELYVAGFPAPTPVITESIFVFREGKVTANSKRAFKDGYGLLYSNDTLPGMSGGPILDGAGKVVGIHGKGDREQITRVKTGFNAGIPIARFADIASALGVETGTLVARTLQSSMLTADDYFVSANQKYRKDDYRGALADYNQAISLKPDYADAYAGRALLKSGKLNDPQGALADYNQAISLKPDYVDAYTDRAFLKGWTLNDPQGALADYNQAISLKPDYADAYAGRASLKNRILKDHQGALADYNQAISLKPNFWVLVFCLPDRANLKEMLNDPEGALADYNLMIALKLPIITFTYTSRGQLKYKKLKDYQGALADYDQAIALDPKFYIAYYYRAILKNEKLNDRQGAITDFQQVVRLSRQQGNDDYFFKEAINQLRSLDANWIFL